MEPSDQSFIQAFEQMWGHYPAPVMLLNKAHVVQAVNSAGQALGITPGINCFALVGRDRRCRHCKAPLALKNGEAQRSVEFSKDFGRVIDGYWIPVAGNAELYVHFGNDITAWADPSKFPEMGPAEAKRGTDG
jgi:hypothetical protein